MNSTISKICKVSKGVIYRSMFTSCCKTPSEVQGAVALPLPFILASCTNYREEDDTKLQQRVREERKREERERQADGGVTMYLVEADNVWMLQQLHDLHLSEDLFQVLIIQLSLIHYLYSHLEREGRREPMKTSAKKSKSASVHDTTTSFYRWTKTWRLFAEDFFEEAFWQRGQMSSRSSDQVQLTHRNLLESYKDASAAAPSSFFTQCRLHRGSRSSHQQRKDENSAMSQCRHWQ